MKLVASVIVRNELGRYLRPCFASLLGFVDEIRVLDDGSTDGGLEWMERQPFVQVLRNPGVRFTEHEGLARDCLFEWTVCGDPTHVLTVDADEFVGDGAAIRRAAETADVDVWTLTMTEVWAADQDGLRSREDGGWRAHESAVLYRLPTLLDHSWRIMDRQLASGREPLAVRASRSRAATGVPLLHFGWANRSERQARYERYRVADGGRFHARSHLDSIVWPDERVMLADRAWPAALDDVRADVVARSV